ncbi:response regulator [Kribbella sp. CA-245084]|uniref:response regulator n=1 Tax=Kribbella sp. CA-245084 TaxID=3239940 RepID=UPI003D8DE709
MTIKVLLLDDEELVRSGIRLILQAGGTAEVVAEDTDGSRVVELVEKYTPDLVLTDIQMPKVNGIEITRRVNALPAPPPVVVLTTFDLDEYVYEALQAGAMGFLLKDIAPRALVDAVEQAVQGDSMLSPQITKRLIAAYTARPAPPGWRRGAAGRKGAGSTSSTSSGSGAGGVGGAAGAGGSGSAGAWGAVLERAGGGAASRGADGPRDEGGGGGAASGGSGGAGGWGDAAREGGGAGAASGGDGAWGYDVLEELTPREREVAMAVGEGLSNAEIARRLELRESTVKVHVTHILAKLAVPNRTKIALLIHDAGLA